MIRNEKIHVALLFGGRSHEHEISLLSAERVYQELKKLDFTIIPIFISRNGKWYIQQTNESLLSSVEETQERVLSLFPGIGISHKGKILSIDVAIPLTHGKEGEDGILQGLLQLIHLPYIGPSPFSSMMGMHKKISKLIAKEASIPVVPHISFSFHDMDQLMNHSYLSKNISHLLGYREYKEESLTDLFSIVTSRLGSSLIIKAEDEGSSVGIEVFINGTITNFYDSLMKVFTYSSYLLVESYIFDMVEVECGVCKKEHIIASNPKVINNPKTDNPHYLSYKQKYFSDIPFSIDSSFPLPSSVSSLIKEYAILISELLLIEGFARVDFFYQIERNKIYFNEINTIPGLTNTSIYPLLMNEIGYPLGEILTLLMYQKLKER
jgi:D-alanine-D-alanine ligase